jgi:hypothetical protein
VPVLITRSHGLIGGFLANIEAHNLRYQMTDTSILLILLSLSSKDPREIQARDSNRKQLNGVENRTALRTL